MKRFRSNRSVCLLSAAMLVSGCGGYGEVSETAYEFSKALYSISNRQAGDKLDQTCAQIEAAQAAGDLTDQEAAWLLQIATDARDGQWKSAMHDARRIMEDQVR